MVVKDSGDESRKTGEEIGGQSSYDQLLERVLASSRKQGQQRRLDVQTGRVRKKTGRGTLWRNLSLLTLGILVASIALGTFLWYYQDSSWSSPVSIGSAGQRAVVVDELSATYPDPSFYRNVSSSLTLKGYAVDYYGPSDVTVSFFQSLPQKGYGLVILRGHGGDSLIYTSEPYSTSKYVVEQLTGQLDRVLLDGHEYFAITASFVQHSMRGSFPGSLIIGMGCSGLSSNGLAQAFVGRGASAFVGWDRSISAYRTDTSTSTLVSALAQGMTVKQAVAKAQMVSDGFDLAGQEPPFNSHIGYYDASTLPKQELGLTILTVAMFLPIIMIPVLGLVGFVGLLKLLARF